MQVETPDRSSRKTRPEQPSSTCPVHVDDAGVWHINSYLAARSVLRSTDTRQAGFGADQAQQAMRNMRPPVVYRDGVEHREHRRQTAKYFTPRRVTEKYREMMHRYADRQLAKLRRKGRADLSKLSFALAVAVAGDVLGLTPARRGTAKRLARFFTESKVQPGLRSPAAIWRLLYTNSAMLGYYLLDVRPAIRLRRKERRDDLISHLLDEGCSNAEILGECVTFGAAGMITTREFITVAAWHLFTDEALRKAYLTGEESDRLAILHEILRLEPVVANLARRTTADIEVPDASGPVRIPAGARVDVAIGQANLDPTTVGEQPAAVCPARPLPDGVADSVLSFGDGPHRCPGSYIAIQETEIFLTKLFALPNLRMEREPDVRFRKQIESYELSGLILRVK